MPFVIDCDIEIGAPAKVVWEVITDLARYPEWNPFVVECSSTLKPGEPIDMKVRLKGDPQKQREWIRELDPGRALSYSMKPFPLGALSSFRSHRIEPLGDAKCRYHSHFELNGWMKALVIGIFHKEFERGFGGMSKGIKARAESLWAQRKPAG